MKIYTRTGDAGQTGLFGGDRLSKDAPRVAAYGDVDELNCALGAALAVFPKEEKLAPLKGALARVQEELFVVGALLATLPGKLGQLKPPFSSGLPEDSAARLETEIDSWTAELPEMKHFILPGGGPLGAALHLARAACRRAERSAVTLSREEPLPDGVLVYLNRLSDHLFVAARWANAKEGRPETPWLGLAKK